MPGCPHLIKELESEKKAVPSLFIGQEKGQGWQYVSVSSVRCVWWHMKLSTPMDIPIIEKIVFISQATILNQGLFVQSCNGKGGDDACDIKNGLEFS